MYVSFMFPQAILRVQRAKSAADRYGTRDWHDTISWRYDIQHSGHYEGLSVHRNADQTTLDLPGNLDKKDIVTFWVTVDGVLDWQPDLLDPTINYTQQSISLLQPTTL
jgi:hypothetical protein